MRGPTRRSHASSGSRRYLIHLSSSREEATGEPRYLIHIQPWAPRSACLSQAQERLFEDESELIQVINPLLPGGSDVRNVLSHVQSAQGFFYLLRLNPEQARTLGWEG